MKKLLFGILSLLIVFNLQAQKTGKDAVKQAEKDLKAFFKDMATNKDMAIKTLDEMEANFGTPEKADAFIKKGDLYKKILEEEEKKGFIDPNYEIILPFTAERAMSSYMDALGTDKQKDALKRLPDIMGSMTFLGNKAFDNKDYNAAFKTYNDIIKIHEVLNENEKDSSFDTPEALNQHKFYTIVAATYSADIDLSEAEGLIKDLYEAKYDHSFIYESYFNLLKEKDKEKAEAILTEGREKYPDDNGLLYAEINYYLQTGQLEKPIGNIKKAIEQDPNNVSLYTTLGSVFDQLNQQKRADGEIEEADEYFGEAMTYFQMAIEKDPENSDANYSLGALYYNKAATMTDMINELSTDYSAEGTKKYEAAKEEMVELFKQAQPFFEKSHMLNGSNRNAIIALKEIYARLGDFDKSTEMKNKLDALGG
jgi:tetratricopeptide (TPR) repeat protein